MELSLLKPRIYLTGHLEENKVIYGTLQMSNWQTSIRGNKKDFRCGLYKFLPFGYSTSVNVRGTHSILSFSFNVLDK